MRELDRYQLKTQLNRGKSVEQLLQPIKRGQFDVLRWIEIRPEDDFYNLIYHEVFDDSNEGMENIYEFSYVVPDDLNGKVVANSISLEDILEKSKELHGVDVFYNAGYLNEIITSANKPG